MSQSYPRRNPDRVIAKARQLVNKDYSVLSDPNSSQDARVKSLENLEARRRQRPAYAYNQENQINNIIPPGTPDMEQEMMMPGPDSAYGYETTPNAFVDYSNRFISTNPAAFTTGGNSTQRGYNDNAEQMGRIGRYAKEQSPTEVLKQRLSQDDKRYLESTVNNLKRQQEMQGVRKEQVFERWERSHTNHTQECLLLVAKGLGMVHESYDSTAGQWVVSMPFINPTSPEQILYNQKGLSNITAKNLQKKQVGHYWVNGGPNRQLQNMPQVPPATPDTPNPLLGYAAANQRSNRSLQNPKRGDDFIRHSRLQMDESVSAPNKSKKRNTAGAISYNKPASTSRTSPMSAAYAEIQKNTKEMEEQSSQFERELEGMQREAFRAGWEGAMREEGPAYPYETKSQARAQSARRSGRKNQQGDKTRQNPGRTPAEHTSGYNMAEEGPAFPFETKSQARAQERRRQGKKNKQGDKTRQEPGMTAAAHTSGYNTNEEMVMSEARANELFNRAKALMEIHDDTTQPSYKRNKAMKEVKEIHNLLKSAAAVSNGNKKKNQMSKLEKRDVAQYSAKLDRMHDPKLQKEDAQLREEIAYDRHLSLLESATQMLSNNPTAGPQLGMRAVNNLNQRKHRL